jgi:hypothetical protein
MNAEDTMWALTEPNQNEGGRLEKKRKTESTVKEKGALEGLKRGSKARAMAEAEALSLL